MDLNLEALLGVTYFVPIATTLRKVYAPDFEVPDTFLRVLDRLDTTQMDPSFVDHFTIAPKAERAAA